MSSQLYFSGGILSLPFIIFLKTDIEAVWGIFVLIECGAGFQSSLKPSYYKTSLDILLLYRKLCVFSLSLSPQTCTRFYFLLHKKIYHFFFGDCWWLRLGIPTLLSQSNPLIDLPIFNKFIISAHTSISFLSYDCVCCYPIFSLNKIIFFLSLSNCNIFLFSPQMNHLFLYASLLLFISLLYDDIKQKKLLKTNKKSFSSPFYLPERYN